MCRLFGLTAGRERARATLAVEAPDSLRTQSHRNADGTGLGTFDEHGRPRVEKAPVAAYDDSAFAGEARERCSSTFVAHVRFATGTPHTLEWLADQVPVAAVNLVLTTADELWAVRWPATRELYVLDRREASATLDQRSRHGTRVHSPDLGSVPSVVVASEPLDDSDWEPLSSGELVHVHPDLRIDRSVVIDRGPARRPS